MPRNYYKFDNKLSWNENIKLYEEFVEEYVKEKLAEGQMPNCKIYGLPTLGEVLTKWLLDNNPSKKSMITNNACIEIAGSKQGYPLAIMSKQLNEEERVQYLKNNPDENPYTRYIFKILKLKEKPLIKELIKEGWHLRKYYNSFKIYNIHEAKMISQTEEELNKILYSIDF